MVDADHFKRVNDTHGHQVGDQVLKMLALTMREHLRDSDILGRFGGEEFIIALPETGNEEALALAARLLEAVAVRKLRIELPDGKAIQITITISIGIASLGADADDLDSLTKEADNALYAAKADGRDRCCSGVGMPTLF